MKTNKPIPKSGEFYPCGPCPFGDFKIMCRSCETIVTPENITDDPCDEECEVCDYCGAGKCPDCGEHIHCGGSI